MALTINGLALLTALVSMPLTGRWLADVTAAPGQGETAAALSGAVELELDGVSFAGTVVRSGVYGNLISARVVAGAGGLEKELPERFYRGSPTVRTIVADILRETGETVAADFDASLEPAGSDVATLGKVLGAWERHRGAGGALLTRLLELHGGAWRANRDGTIRIVGTETWPTVDPEHVLVGADYQAGWLLVRPLGTPDLEPGVTFQGHRVQYVEHELSSGALLTRVYFADPRSLAERERKGLDRGEWYSRLWPALVEKQNADLSLDVVIGNSFGLTQVPIRHGLPGLKVGVAQGARVLVGFEGADPRAPFAVGWAQSGSLKVGTYLLVVAGAGAPVPGVVISFTFFKADTAGETALAAAIVAATAAGQIAHSQPITTDFVKVV